MNTQPRLLPALFLTLFTAAAQAGPRTSANYSVFVESLDGGGKRATSTSYTNDGSAGGIIGISTVASPADTAKQGYIGQLTEVTALQLAAASLFVDEGTTRQLTAAQVLDDATTLAVDATAVSWSVVNGPIVSVSAAGLATAGTVYEPTDATVQGGFAGDLATLGLSVMNVASDNYQAYAGDGIDDDWQVLYFNAPPNANAGPTADPDGDGQKNLFEFIAGARPDDPASRFRLRIEPVTGAPTQKKLIFSPRFVDRTYTVESNLNLGATWTNVPGLTVLDDGPERTATDPNANTAKKFYRVQITKP